MPRFPFRILVCFLETLETSLCSASHLLLGYIIPEALTGDLCPSARTPFLDKIQLLCGSFSDLGATESYAYLGDLHSFLPFGFSVPCAQITRPLSLASKYLETEHCPQCWGYPAFACFLPSCLLMSSKSRKLSTRL